MTIISLRRLRSRALLWGMLVALPQYNSNAHTQTPVAPSSIVDAAQAALADDVGIAAAGPTSLAESEPNNSPGSADLVDLSSLVQRYALVSGTIAPPGR